MGSSSEGSGRRTAFIPRPVVRSPDREVSGNLCWGEASMRVLILGGTGLTGPYAVCRLHGLGHEVTVFHRGEHKADLPVDVHHVHGDFAKPPSELLDPGPEVVVHMMAMTEADAESFLNTFCGVADRAIVISSGDVYGAYG